MANPSVYLYRRPHSGYANSFLVDDDTEARVVEKAPARSQVEGGADGVSLRRLNGDCTNKTSSSESKDTSRIQQDPDDVREQSRKAEDDSTGKNQHRRMKQMSDKASDLCDAWMHSQWPILLVSILVFSILAGAGLAFYFLVKQAREEDLQDSMVDLAQETGDFFSKELDFAIMPLFTMAQFATDLVPFANLPDKIKSPGEPGALPFLNNTGSSAHNAIRNITGVCDDPTLVQRFTEIASSIKSNAKMDGVLHNIQLAPEGVVCLLHPMNNTEDFSDGVTYLDSTGALGVDLLNDPFHQYIARTSLEQEEIGIVGPRELLQCPTCGLYFIVRLPVVSRTHFVIVDGEEYPGWGFATALINWDALVERSGMHERFRGDGYEFQLTRTDFNFNDTTQDYDVQVVALAESAGFGSKRKEVSTVLETTNNEWVITIQYEESHVAQHVIVVISIFAVALFIAALIYTVLLQKQTHMTMVGNTAAEKEKVELERHLTAALAHELRNPLGAIDSALHTMPDNISEETKELVASMQLCSSFMQSIITNLLDSRKLEEGKMSLLTNPFSIKKLLSDVHKMFLPAVVHDVAWLVDVTRISDDKDWVFGDAKRIQQILTNFISNAIKHTRTGSITISAEWTTQEKGGREVLKFICSDTGPGIPKEDQTDLFERFTTRGGAPGSGLGLSIAKQLVGLMGGSIYFESDPTIKPGTDCVAVLPLKVCDESRLSMRELDLLEKKVSDSKNHLEEPIKVLITDDIKMNRMMLKRRFQKCIAPNCSITEAATGEEALRICESQSFDLIIMDQFMQEAGGVLVGTDVIIALRRSNVTAVVIGCSGNDLDEKFFASGADMTWKKPIPTNADIIQSIRQQMAAKREAKRE